MTDTNAPETDDPDPSIADRFRTQVAENRTGMFHDLVFALVWVAIVSLLFDLVFVDAPTWAYYMFMLAGVPAYFGFVISLKTARTSR